MLVAFVLVVAAIIAVVVWSFGFACAAESKDFHQRVLVRLEADAAQANTRAAAASATAEEAFRAAEGSQYPAAEAVEYRILAAESIRRSQEATALNRAALREREELRQY